MSQQLSFLDAPAPPPLPIYTPTARELESVTAADTIIDMLETFGEQAATAVARAIAQQARLHPAMARWAVDGFDAQYLALAWPWERRTRLAHVQRMARMLAVLMATRCPKCRSDALVIDRFGRETTSGFGQTFHCEYRWRCRACRAKWNEHMDALRARTEGGA